MSDRTREADGTEREPATVEDSLARRPVDHRAAVLESLSRGAGNALVSRHLATLARDPDTKERAPSAQKEKGEKLEARLDAVAKQASLRTSTITSGVQNGIGIVDDLTVHLMAVADRYAEAFASFESVLERADAEVKQREALGDLVLGIAIGVAVGAALGPLAAVAAGAGKAASAFVDAQSEAAEWVVGRMVAGPDGDGQAGGRAARGRMHPALQRLEAYKKVAGLYRDLALLAVKVQPVAQLSESCARGLADCRELAVSGRHRSLATAELERRVSALERAGDAQQQIAENVTTLLVALADARREAAKAAEEADVTRMRRQLFIHWMASLSEAEADEVLDTDAVRDAVDGIGWAGPPGTDFGPFEEGTGGPKAGRRQAKKYAEALKLIGKVGRITVTSQGGTSGGTLEFPDQEAWESREDGTEARVAKAPKGWTVVLHAWAETGDEVQVTDVRRVTDERFGVGGDPVLLGRPLKPHIGDENKPATNDPALGEVDRNPVL